MGTDLAVSRNKTEAEGQAKDILTLDGRQLAMEEMLVNMVDRLAVMEQKQDSQGDIVAKLEDQVVKLCLNT